MSRSSADPRVGAAALDGTGLEKLLEARPVSSTLPRTRSHTDGPVIGRLVALDVDTAAPLVVYEGQPSSGALRARATVDLHGIHIGREVLLVFEKSDPTKPIVVGCLTESAADVLPEMAGLVEVDADGQRLKVTARNQLVLQCGKARITLTRAGKVLLEGTYISSRSSGVNRVKGGSVQLN
jgi:hypothetical protein